MKTIVVALDFSDASGPVLESAAKMAGVFGATLHLVHVVEPEPTYSAYGFTPEEFPAIHVFQKEARARAEAALNEKRKTLDGDLRVETHLLEGNPLHALLEFVGRKMGCIIHEATLGCTALPESCCCQGHESVRPKLCSYHHKRSWDRRPSLAESQQNWSGHPPACQS